MIGAKREGEREATEATTTATEAIAKVKWHLLTLITKVMVKVLVVRKLTHGNVLAVCCGYAECGMHSDWSPRGRCT